MNRVAAPLPNTVEDPRFPGSDGKPMGDTNPHMYAQIALHETLRRYFAGRDVYIAANLILYWDSKNPKIRRDPDILIAKGVGTHNRRTFKIWEERNFPCTLIEIVSNKTWKTDIQVKPREYAAIGVKEYFLFEPEQDHLDPQLQGFRTVKNRPVPMKPAADGSLVSKQLGLRLMVEGALIRLYDLQTGEPILSPDEEADQERARAEQERARAEQERQRAEQEQARAEQEKARADAATAELERLRALLREQEGHSHNGAG